MQVISTIDSNPYQKFSYILDDGSRATIILRFFPTQNRWVMDISDENGFEANGIFVCCGPNILDKWHNVIKYGINIATEDGIDPSMQDDFATGYAMFSMLDEKETKEATDYLNGL